MSNLILERRKVGKGDWVSAPELRRIDTEREKYNIPFRL